MICPKCGFKQPDSDECIKCGIIISKYVSSLRRKEASESKAAYTVDDAQQGAVRRGGSPVATSIYADVTALQDEVRRIAAELSRLKIERDRMLDGLKAVEERIFSLGERVDDVSLAASEYAKLAAELGELRQLACNASATAAEAEDLRRTIAQISGEVDEIKQLLIADLERLREFDKSKEAASESQAMIALLKSDIEALKSEVKELKMQNADEKHALAAQEIIRLREEVKSFHDQIESLKDAIARLADAEGRLEELQAWKEKFKEGLMPLYLPDVSSEIQGLRQDLKEIKGFLADLLSGK